MTEAWNDLISGYLERSMAVKKALLERCPAQIAAVADACADSLKGGGKILIFGNGGSAADAQHMAAELVVRLISSFEREAIPALALTVDSSLLTACSNDYGYEYVFSRQLEAFGQEGDIAIGISTSGNSGNVVKAFEVARERGVKTVLMSGESGGKLKDLADLAILVPSEVTSHIQECHIACIHMICEIIERKNHARV